MDNYFMNQSLRKSKLIICLLLCFVLSGCFEDNAVVPTDTVATTLNDAKNAIKQALNDGKKVKSVFPTALGANGWTILFADDTSVQIPINYKNEPTAYITIGSDRYWFISNDLGISYDYLKDNEGHQIHAVDSINSSEKIIRDVYGIHGSSFINAIAEDNLSHKLSISFSDGNVITLPKSENILQDFSFTAEQNKGIIPEDLVYCIGMNEINMITPYVIDKSHLVAKFTTPKNNKVYVGEQEQKSGISSNNFNNPLTLKVVSSDGNTNKYTVKIQNTGLPVVYIKTPGNAEITSKTEWLNDAQITIYRADETVDYESDKLQIKGRGNSTWDFPKKPFAIKLDKKAEILGMPKHKRWVLLANWMDRTLLRNEFAFEIARNTGLAWTPRGQFVEVILNGKHIGNYYLCEQIKIDKNRVDIAEMAETDIEGDNLTGGYLMELDVLYDEINKFMSETKALPYMFKEPDEETLQPAQMEYLQNYINSMEKSLYADNWLDTRAYTEYLDLPSFADYWFVHELAENGEPKMPKSRYMYKDRLGKLTAGPVWDFDWKTFLPGNTDFCIKEATYYDRLFQDEEFVTIVKNRWKIYKSAFLTLPDKIRSEAKFLRYSAKINHDLWPLDNAEKRNGDELMDFVDAVERMVSTYQNRLEWLDKEIEKL